METIEQCPICAYTQFEPFLRCEDFTFSHEHFQLMKCKSCSLVFTSPRPDRQSLPVYYQSDQYISHTNKSKGFLHKIYRVARNFTLRWKINIISELTESKTPSILDYGCGTGEFLEACQSQHWKIAGFEPSDAARQKSEAITGTNIANELEQLANQKFDVITLWHVLEHVSELKYTLTILTSLLRQGGYLIIAVPNHESPDAQFYKQHWAAYDVPRHLWHFTKSVMQQLTKDHGLNIKKIRPMKLDAYYVSLLSEKYRNSNHNSIITLIKGTFRGMASNLTANPSLNHSSLIYVITK